MEVCRCISELNTGSGKAVGIKIIENTNHMLSLLSTFTKQGERSGDTPSLANKNKETDNSSRTQRQE